MLLNLRGGTINLFLKNEEQRLYFSLGAQEL
jgi:hypothetical protein